MQRLIIRLGMVAILAFAAALAQAQTCSTPDATIISPTPGSVLPSSGTVTFSWCNASADYFVTIETVQGAHDIFFAFTGGAGGGAGQNFLTLPVVSSLPNALCQPAPPIGCIPALGETIYFTLQTVKAKTILGTHLYTYTAGGGSGGGTAVWNGGTGVWSNPAMWTGGVPSGGNVNVFIDKGNALASAVTLDMNALILNLTVDGNDSLSLNDTRILGVNGTAVSNAGNLFIKSLGNPTGLTLSAGKSVSLGGGGKINLLETVNNGNAFIRGASGSTLTNADNLIQGAGQIGPGLTLVNQAKGMIVANQGFPLTISAAGVSNAGSMKAMPDHTLIISSPLTNTGTIQAMGAASNIQITQSFSNTGKLIVNGGGTMKITGPFSNFSSTTSTLTGGTYMLTGTLQFQDANIVKNAAAITLTGTNSKIVNQLGVGALKNLASNLSGASFTLQSGRLFTTPAAFTNAGTLLVGVNSGFGTATSYTQTAGKTTVDGSLSAPGGMQINAGSLLGKGTIQSTVIAGGSVTAGDSATAPGQLSIAGTYSQTATGILNISIGSLKAGKLAVTNGVSLNGKLVLKRVNSFVPAIGDTFTILTGSAVSGKFATVTGLAINAGEHFQVNYLPTSVTVTVVSGP